MAYQTGTATGVSDMLSIIQTFAQSNGWTINSGKSARSDDVSGEAICIQKTATDGTIIAGTIFSDMESVTPTYDPGYRMGCMFYPSYNAGSGNMEQPNNSGQAVANGFRSAGFVAYHLFTHDNFIHCSIEVTSGTYKHLGIGMVDKFGVVTTGVYAFAGSRLRYDSSYWQDVASSYNNYAFSGYEGSSRLGACTLVRADCDGIGNRIYDTYSASFYHRLMCGISQDDTIDHALFKDMPASTLTGRAILTPIMLSVERGNLGGNYWSPIGYVPDIRWVQMTNLASGSTITIAGEDWLIVPMIRRNGATGEPSSGTYGMAFRKRP